MYKKFLQIYGLMSIFLGMSFLSVNAFPPEDESKYRSIKCLLKLSKCKETIIGFSASTEIPTSKDDNYVPPPYRIHTWIDHKGRQESYSVRGEGRASENWMQNRSYDLANAILRVPFDCPNCDMRHKLYERLVDLCEKNKQSSTSIKTTSKSSNKKESTSVWSNEKEKVIIIKEDEKIGQEGEKPECKQQ